MNLLVLFALLPLALGQTGLSKQAAIKGSGDLLKLIDERLEKMKHEILQEVKACDSKASQAIIGYSGYASDQYLTYRQRANFANAFFPSSYYSDGVFTPPVDGYYLFSVSAFTKDDHVVLHLFQNDAIKHGTFSDQPYWDQGSFTGILLCSAGDRIEVRQNYREGGTLLKTGLSSDDILSTFTAALLLQI